MFALKAFNKINIRCAVYSVQCTLHQVYHMTASQCFECKSSNCKINMSESGWHQRHLLGKSLKKDEKTMNRTQKTSRRPPMHWNELLRLKKGGIVKGGKGVGAVSSRSFDLLNSMIYGPRWSVYKRWMIEHGCYIHPLMILLLFYCGYRTTNVCMEAL